MNGHADCVPSKVTDQGGGIRDEDATSTTTQAAHPMKLHCPGGRYAFL